MQDSKSKPEENNSEKTEEKLIFNEIFALPDGGDSNKGEYECGKDYGKTALERMGDHLEMLAAIVADQHNHHPQKGNKHFITRLTLTEFSLYPSKDGLQEINFKQLLQKISEIAKKLPSNIHLNFASVPELNEEGNGVFNTAIYVQCQGKNREPKITRIRKLMPIMKGDGADPTYKVKKSSEAKKSLEERKQSNAALIERLTSGRRAKTNSEKKQSSSIEAKKLPIPNTSPLFCEALDYSKLSSLFSLPRIDPSEVLALPNITRKNLEHGATLFDLIQYLNSGEFTEESIKDVFKILRKKRESDNQIPDFKNDQFFTSSPEIWKELTEQLSENESKKSADRNSSSQLSLSKENLWKIKQDLIYYAFSHAEKLAGLIREKLKRSEEMADYNNIIKCQTAGGLEFITIVEICNDHSCGMAMFTVINMIENNELDFSNLIITHTTTANIVPVHFAHIINSPFVLVNPKNEKELETSPGVFENISDSKLLSKHAWIEKDKENIKEIINEKLQFLKNYDKLQRPEIEITSGESKAIKIKNPLFGPAITLERNEPYSLVKEPYFINAYCLYKYESALRKLKSKNTGVLNRTLQPFFEEIDELNKKKEQVTIKEIFVSIRKCISSLRQPAAAETLNETINTLEKLIQNKSKEPAEKKDQKLASDASSISLLSNVSNSPLSPASPDNYILCLNKLTDEIIPLAKVFIESKKPQDSNRSGLFSGLYAGIFRNLNASFERYKKSAGCNEDDVMDMLQRVKNLGGEESDLAKKLQASLEIIQKYGRRAEPKWHNPAIW